MAKRKSADNVGQSPVSFEDSLGELQAIVSALEDGSLGLESSLAQFERGIKLLRSCYSILESAEARVEILTQFQGDESGPVSVPFEAEATFEATRERAATTSSSGQDSFSSGDSSKPSLF
ncbi:MAG: exodeoxyribonuclease VII small subunit [Planctomycetes bacterium]|nr:exodeoxyribonuclease VII small subunit [Planctomycetota bacterium]